MANIENRKKENLALIKNVARCLDARLDGPEYDHGGAIIFDNGAKLFFRLPYYPDNKMKGEVSGSWPQDVDGRAMSARDWQLIGYNEPNPCEIGFSVLKDPEKIASDIRRRFLFKYFEMWEEAIKKKQKRLEEKNASENAFLRIRKATGVSFGTHEKTGFSGYLWQNDANPYVRGEMSGEKVKLELSYLTADQAVRLFKFLENEKGR